VRKKWEREIGQENNDLFDLLLAGKVQDGAGWYHTLAQRLSGNHDPGREGAP